MNEKIFTLKMVVGDKNIDQGSIQKERSLEDKKNKMTKKGKTGEEAEYRRIKAKERKGFFENKNLSRRVERKRLKEA